MHSTDKASLRNEILAARRARLADELATARAAIRAHVLDRAAREGWRTLAGYEPLATEPGSVEQSRRLLLVHVAGEGAWLAVAVERSATGVSRNSWCPASLRVARHVAIATGRCSRPRSVNVVRRTGSPASSISGKRRTSVPIAAAPSSRASAAPKQKW